MKAGRFIVVALLMLTLAGCKSEKKADQASDTGVTSAVDFKVDNSIKLDGQPVTVAGITITPPASWKTLPASGMRQAVFTYGPTQGESDSATMVVFYFGQTGGGAIDANIERWIGQIALPGGGDPHSVAKKQEFTVDGMKAHWVEVSGTYNASMGGGGMMGQDNAPKENYRMAAVVLEGPQGNVFFKLTGPAKTASEMEAAFRTMISQTRKAA